MIYLGDLGDLWEWFKKIPRPDRSGWASVFICCTLIQGIGVGVAVDPDLRCLLNPYVCQEQRDEAQEQVAKKYRMVYLEVGGHGEKACTCHYDVRSNGVITHYHSDVEESCDSDHYAAQEWVYNPAVKCTSSLGAFISFTCGHVGLSVKQHGVYSFVQIDGKDYRLHCEGPHPSGRR